MRGQRLSYDGAVFRLHVYQKQVLRRSQTDFQPELLHNAAQSGFEAVLAGVLDSARLNEQSEEIIAVQLLMPAKRVALSGKFKWTRGLQFPTQPFLDFLPEPLHAFFFE